MNSYNLGISGSWFVLALLLIAAIGFVAAMYFRTVPPISNLKKIVLISIRSIAVILLIFALFEPVFTGFKSSIIKPKIMVLFDNSASMGMDDAAGSRRKAYKTSIEKSRLVEIERNELKIRKFGDVSKELKNFAFDSLSLNEQSTDISAALQNIIKPDNPDNIRAAVIFSDGAFNNGRNPVYTAEELGIPVFTVGIGDTTEPKDIVVKSLIVNEIAYINNPIPINVNIKAAGYKNSVLKISLLDNETVINSSTILIDSDNYEGTAYFTYNPKEAGNRKITIRTAPLDGEITLLNNSISEFVKVLKNKRIISIFGGAPSPDISFIKQYLSTLSGIEVREYLQSSGSTFFTQPTENDIASTELFMLVGFPNQSTPDVILEKISRELSNGKPVFFMSSLNTDFAKLRKLEENLPFNTASSRAAEFNITPEFTQKSVTSPIFRVDGSEKDIEKWQNLPPIFRTETFVRVKPESEVLAMFKVNNVVLNEPFLMSRNINSKKSVAIIGYGLYRWKLLGYAAEQAKGSKESFDSFSKLLENTVRWLSVSDLNKRINISTSKKFYSKGENVEFVGQVYDASYLPVDNASITLNITSKSEKRTVSMYSLGNGRYSAVLEGLAAGDYSYIANVKRQNLNLGSESGRFTIGETGLEFRSLKMEQTILKAIADGSGGKFYNVENVDNIQDDILKLPTFKEKPLTKRSDLALWNYPWLMAISLFLFSIEWLIRKRSGLL